MLASSAHVWYIVVIMAKRNPAILIFLAGLAVMTLTFLNKSALTTCYLRLSFYCILTLFLCWVTVTILYLKNIGFNSRLFLTRYWKGIVFAFLMSAVIFVSAKPYFRILSDETNMLAVSKSMLYEKKVENSMQGLWHYNNYNVIDAVNDKRPFLFPLLTSVVHTLAGYSALSPFAVNFVFLFSLLSMIFIFIEKHFGAVYAYSAVLLAAAQPVISQTASSAGFDLSMVVFIVISFICLYKYLMKPDAPAFQLLWVNLLMLANTRYDGLLFLLIIIPMLAALKYVRSSFLNSSVIYLTPVLMLPVFWQRFCVDTKFENPAGEPAFSIANIFKHTHTFFNTFFNFSYYYPYASVINIAGAGAALYLLYSCILETWPAGREKKHFVLIAMVCYGASWLAITAFHAGSPGVPGSFRYFCLTALILSLLCIIVAVKIAALKDKGVWVITAASMLFLMYNPVTVENMAENTYSRSMEYGYEMDFLEKQGTHNILVISDWPGEFTARNYGAVSFIYAKEHRDDLLKSFNNHLFEHVYVFQIIRYDRLEPEPIFNMNKVFELKTRDTGFLRISEVSI